MWLVGVAAPKLQIAEAQGSRRRVLVVPTGARAVTGPALRQGSP